MRLTQCARNLNKLLDIKSLKQLDQLSTFHPSPLSIKQFLEFGQTGNATQSYLFLRSEIPVRLSNIMKEINLLPGNLLQMPSVLIIQEWYAQAFREIIKFEKRDPTPETLEEFCQVLKTDRIRNVNVVQVMAQGVLELQESHKVDNQTDMAIQYFLDRFYMSRISLRMLMNQHTMLFENEADRSTKRIGMIDPSCRIKGTILDAFHNASSLCEEYYNLVPDIKFIGNFHTVNERGKKTPITLVYPPSHLYHILLELFKNAMRATVEFHQSQSSVPLSTVPEIEVLLTKGTDDVSIRISDQGGGISRGEMSNLFHYLYSTAPRPSMTPTKTPLAGYGYGLPLSRLYARYFHGELKLNSYHGYGTDAVIYLKTDPAQEVELLPIFNKTSTKQYRSSISIADWSDPTYVFNKGSHHHPTTRISSSNTTE